ncbi:MoaF C-terminal domain-containing protein [Marinobacter sp. GN3S48]|uniref:MoaF C-terminal domain-containing protein n=1 Tax=Marinobacter sp. GN3S48 TaxID=3382302 RepID=UPI00387B4F17
MADIKPPMDYIPEDEWPSVANMADGFGEQTLPPTAALSGTALTLEAEDGNTIEYLFTSASELTWKSSGGKMAATGSATYKAIEVRKDIFLVDFVTGEAKEAQNITFVYNKATGSATAGVSWFVPKANETRSATEFVHSKTPDSEGPYGHPRSDGLVGKRIYYRYSDVETYEHIYLSPGTFTWHCIRGGEAGLADTDRCKTFSVAEDLYMFFWTEKVMAVDAVLLVDLHAQRSMGRMFCWDHKLDESVVIPFNSRLTVLNETTYPNDFSKH